ncbi:ATP-binding protein [Amycolatopsis sp. NPDC026612]|uniref:ATP-binding protein n=1 Tax=Amycolatopsis sp. NPDC026612 TaxID=3155466 RepID=UPI00341179D0
MPTDLALTLTSRHESTLVTVTGKLDLPGYAVLRDGLLKVAADTPPGLIADVNGLVITEMSPAALLSLVAKRITDWPGIPFSVVTRQPAQLEALHERGTDLFVPVHPDVPTAERHQRTPIQRRTERTIRRTEHATIAARSFVRELVALWQVPELNDDGTMIAAELVDNTIRHTSSPAYLRLELRHGMLTIAVADDDPHPAVLLERTHPRDPGLGLHMIAHAARAWGSSSRWSGGKTVWAVLTTKNRPSG